MRDKLVAACEVWWSENQDPSECNLQESDNPEKFLMAKEALESFSSDAKLFVNTLINLPDEFFTHLSKPIKGKVIKLMQSRFHWTAKKTKKVQQEIFMCLS